jgi:eukaryotic-like serine/threonine-protein kinase
MKWTSREIRETRMKHPADKLVGMILEGGYEVRKKIRKTPDHTGGNFSVSYVAHKDGKDYFLKATDVTFYRGGGDQATRLRDALTIYTYERTILEMARMHAMTRVVRVLAAGDVPVKYGDPKTGEIEIPVFYLIFENADGSLRDRMLDSVPVEPIDKLKALHHTALGLRQLHSKEIAHQDVKPSNVVNFLLEAGGAHYKVADLGCASLRDRPALHDSLDCPGDRRYAPPETLYGFPSHGFDRRRLGADLYLLGSLIAQIFTGVSITRALEAKLPETHRPGKWNDPYDQLLPRLLEAFDAVLLDLKRDWPYKKEDPQIGERLELAVRQLCCPDPMRRGHPRAFGTVNPLDLDRYVSLFDALIHRASIAEHSKELELERIAGPGRPPRVA